jgi:energy-coupling factor transporter ATP-binding protein EcfA2
MSLELRHSSYTYPGADRPAVEDVSLAVQAGEFVLLTGPTGCGKSTLLRLAAGLLGHAGGGQVAGDVEVGGQSLRTLTPSMRVRQLGFVSQVPGDQLVAGTVGDEVAFGLESAGFGVAEMDARVEDALRSVGLDVGLSHPCTALSGGQMQRLVVAAAMSGSPSVLLLDEPLAQLDPGGAAQLLAVLRHIAEQGVAVLMVEHRVHMVAHLVDRILVMDKGAIIGDGEACLAQVGLGRALESPAKKTKLGRRLMRGRDLNYRYAGQKDRALVSMDFELRAGERVALMGPNGSGKSTLLRVLSGEFKARSLESDCTIIDVPQDPDLALFCATVQGELAYAAEEARCPKEEVQTHVSRVAKMMNLEPFLALNPHGLSRGQRLRVAVGAAMSVQPDVLLLDEPTSGQDRGEVARLMGVLAAMSEHGAVVFATHDEELAQATATRIVRMQAGRVVAVEGAS